MSNLNINDLSYSYNGKPILSGLSFALQNNEIVCLLGSSGCGKTTTLKAIAGLIKPNAGSIQISGVTVNDDTTFTPPQKRNIGMMFQDYALFPHLTVAQNVAFGLTKLSKAQKATRVNEMLALIHLTEFAERYPHQLSGGQQQRVAIARALAYKPDLLLLDEPFSNIDHQVRFQLIEDIRRIIKDQKVSAIFVTHSKEEAYAFSDRLAIMEQGKIAQIGPAQALYSAPNSRVVAEFLSHGIYLDAEQINTTEFNTALGCVESLVAQSITDKKGQIYLKPQYITLQKSPQGEAEFISSRFIGSEYLSRVLYEKQEIEIPSKEVSNFEKGERLKLTVAPHAVNFFPNLD